MLYQLSYAGVPLYAIVYGQREKTTLGFVLDSC